LGSMVPFRWEKQHHAWLSIQFTIDKRGCSPLYFLMIFCRNSIDEEVAMKSDHSAILFMAFPGV
jgi:hypothetical protein